MSQKFDPFRRRVTAQLGATGLLLATPAVAGSDIVTPHQTRGPFHPVDEQDDTDLDLTHIEGHIERAQGETILVRGRVTDTRGRPQANALVDVWQANHHGRYSHPRDPNTAPLDPHFQGWGLLRTDAAGYYKFRTIMPGAYGLEALGGQGWRCRHIHFEVTGGGGRKLTTQMYFEGDPLIEQDAEIAEVPREHWHLLIAQSTTHEPSGLPEYRFDIVLPADA